MDSIINISSVLKSIAHFFGVNANEFHYLYLIMAAFIVLYWQNYFLKKGQNRAIKEDIGKITEKIEDIRTEYAKQLETFRAELSNETERLRIILSFQGEMYRHAAEVRFKSVLTLWEESLSIVV